MKCQAKKSDLYGMGRRCERTAIVGIFCAYHIDYIEKLECLLKTIQEELRRIKKVKEEDEKSKTDTI